MVASSSVKRSVKDLLGISESAPESVSVRDWFFSRANGLDLAVSSNLTLRHQRKTDSHRRSNTT